MANSAVKQAVNEILSQRLAPIEETSLLLELLDTYRADDVLEAAPEAVRAEMADAWEWQLGDATNIIRFSGSKLTDRAIAEYLRWRKARRGE
jgi:hypothetical protein